MNYAIGGLTLLCCFLIICHLLLSGHEHEHKYDRYIAIEFALYLIAAAICFK